MTPPSSPSAAAAPAIRTRPQLDAVLENIASLQRARDELHRAQENEIADVRQRYRAPLAEMDTYLDLEMSWAEAWARENPGAFDADGALRCADATIGFRTMPAQLDRASRRWTWSRIALTLAELDWARHYLRTPPPEVDRDALLADLARLSPIELRAVGIKIVQGERFYITPHAGAETTSAPGLETEWREAA